MKWMGLAILSFALMAGTGCKDKQNPLVTEAEDAVKQILKDPGSVEFRYVSVVQVATPAGKDPIVCGEFNARNSLGGYVGFEPFAWHPDGKLLTKAAMPDADLEVLYSGLETICSGKLYQP
ncbi:hypothetical protein [uncultured Stenotrophomonas sp.]|uniref:hypothetical protein n=1 Tax=uncultured Stenotrophomonas sp. TaxID=165438 RepID=UPI002803DE94|nr:hypothetical protein [uncultured Stenotrophomonas sp.]